MKTKKSKAKVLGPDVSTTVPATESSVESADNTEAPNKLKVAMEQRTARTPHLNDEKREAYRRTYARWLDQPTARLTEELRSGFLAAAGNGEEFEKEFITPILAAREHSETGGTSTAATPAEQDKELGGLGPTTAETPGAGLSDHGETQTTAEPAELGSNGAAPASSDPIWSPTESVAENESPLRAAAGATATPHTRVTLSIGDIVIDPDFQCRVSPNDDTVGHYMERMKAGDQFPAATVFSIEGRFVLVDGRHRVAACSNLGLESIDVIVRSGTRHDALQYAFSANTDHGLPLTRADKRRAAVLAIAAFPDWTSRRLAELLKCSTPFIEKIRKTSPGSVPSSRVGRDGRAYVAKGDSIIEGAEQQRLNQALTEEAPRACEPPAESSNHVLSAPETTDRPDNEQYVALRSVTASLMQNWGITAPTMSSWLRRIADELSPEALAA